MYMLTYSGGAIYQCIYLWLVATYIKVDMLIVLLWLQSYTHNILILLTKQN